MSLPAPRPNGNLQSGTYSNVEQRSESVMPIHDAHFLWEEVSNDRQSRKPTVLPDESCRCPKPLTSVFDICRWCIQAKGGVCAYPTNAEDGLTIKDVLARLYLMQFPSEPRPIANRKVAKEFIPPQRGQRQAIYAKVRLYPRFKYLLRHLRERLARQIGKRGISHEAVISADQSSRCQNES